MASFSDHVAVILGSFWIMMGSSWDHFGIILAPSWDDFGVMLGSSWDQCGVLLASSWDHFGVMLASSWDHFRSILASSWDHFGVTVASSGDQFEIIWESFWHRSGTNDFHQNVADQILAPGSRSRAMSWGEMTRISKPISSTGLRLQVGGWRQRAKPLRYGARRKKS